MENASCVYASSSLLQHSAFILLFWALIGRIHLKFKRNYNESFAIYHILDFWPSKNIFQRNLSQKTSIFLISRKAVATFLSLLSHFFSQLGIANVHELTGRKLSVWVVAAIVFVKNFYRPVLATKWSENLPIIWNFNNFRFSDVSLFASFDGWCCQLCPLLLKKAVFSSLVCFGFVNL